MQKTRKSERRVSQQRIKGYKRNYRLVVNRLEKKNQDLVLVNNELEKFDNESSFSARRKIMEMKGRELSAEIRSLESELNKYEALHTSALEKNEKLDNPNF